MRFVILILFFLSFITLVNSNEIETLVNSYDYSYSSYDFKLNAINLTILNENKINILLNISGKPQHYVMNLILENKKNGLIKNQSFQINSINNFINSDIEVSNLDEDNYTLMLFIYDENKILVYRNYNLSSIMINQDYFVLDKTYLIEDKNTTFFEINTTFILNDEFELNLSKIKNNTYGIIYYSDLVLKNISYNQSSGEGDFEIKNIGKSDAIWFKNTIFDENFTLLFESNIEYLLINQSINVSFNISSNISSNLSKFVIIADFDNNLDEINKLNNYLFWPVNLTEICGNGLDDNRDEKIDENCIVDGTKIISQLSTSSNVGTSGTRGGGGSSSLQNINKNEVSLIEIIKKEEKEVKLNDSLKFNFDNFNAELKIINLSSDFVVIYYNQESILLNKEEGVEINYDSKPIIVKYLGLNLDNALFRVEFENEIDEFEIKSEYILKEQNNSNTKLNKSINLENYDSLKSVINTSSNIDNLSLLLANIEKNSNLNEKKLDFKYYLILSLVILIVVGIVFIFKIFNKKTL